MFAQDGTANQFAWRYYRDWNGYGARTKSTFISDCASITGIESTYNKTS